MKRAPLLVSGIAAGLLLGACSSAPESDFSGPIPLSFESPHEAHAYWIRQTGLEATVVGRRWMDGSVGALRDPASIPLPYQEEGLFGPEDGMALGYRLRIPRGQKVEFTLEDGQGGSVPFFIDAYPAQVAASVEAPGRGQRSTEPLWSAGPSSRLAEFEPPDSGEYVFRLQPEVLKGGSYRIAVRPRAILEFPVFGQDTRAIQSYFGAPREGGRRQHHGVDIFAPRGTPVVASTAGRVNRVETTRLGGRVVWLRDRQRNQSLYYAHLDLQLVEDGQEVQPGDTLGLVGNTGNARTTPPHLHFGIYRRGEGPVNPYPFLREPSGATEPLEVDPLRFGDWVSPDREGLRLRAGPSVTADAVTDLPEGSVLRVVAGAGEWYRVLTAEGRSGFVLGRLTTEASSATQAPVVADGAGQGQD